VYEPLWLKRFVLRHGTVGNTDLERLDFENNPATTIKAYRHQLVRRLPRVTELDGEEVTPLDRELAEQYAASEGVRTLLMAPCYRPCASRSAGGRSTSACELSAPSIDPSRTDPLTRRRAGTDDGTGMLYARSCSLW
jgi:hypothetical protein